MAILRTLLQDESSVSHLLSTGHASLYEFTQGSQQPDEVSSMIPISQMGTPSLKVVGPGLYLLPEPSWIPLPQAAFDLTSNQIKMISKVETS